MESTLLTEAGDLINGLTEDVQQLQQENTLVQLSVDSLTEENFLLSDTIASLERAAESAARVSADEMDDLKAVNGSLLNKVHKLESLLALEDTKNKDLRDQLEDKLHELKLVVQEDKDNANIHVREVEVLRKEKRIIAELNEKMCKYASGLEKECKEQHAHRCHEHKKRIQLQQHNDLLVKEVSILKVLGLSYTPSYRAVSGMSDEEKLGLLQYEIEAVVKRVMDPKAKKEGARAKK